MGNEYFYLTGGTSMVEDTVRVIIPGRVEREWLAVPTGDWIQPLVIKEGIDMNERYLRDWIWEVLLQRGRECRETRKMGGGGIDWYLLFNRFGGYTLMR
jgi:hypothetical protein